MKGKKEPALIKKVSVAEGCIDVALMLAAAAAVTTSSAQAGEDLVQLNTILPLTGLGAFLGTQEKTSLEVLEKTVNAGGGIHGRFFPEKRCRIHLSGSQ